MLISVKLARIWGGEVIGTMTWLEGKSQINVQNVFPFDFRPISGDLIAPF